MLVGASTPIIFLFAPQAMPSSVIVRLLSIAVFKTATTTASAFPIFFTRVFRHSVPDRQNHCHEARKPRQWRLPASEAGEFGSMLIAHKERWALRSLRGRRRFVSSSFQGGIHETRRSVLGERRR